MEKSKAFLIILICFIGGVMIGSFFNIRIIFVLPILILGGVGMLFYNPRIFLIGIVLLGIVLGILRIESVEARNSLLDNFVDEEIIVKAYISNESKYSSNSSQVYVRTYEVLAFNQRFMLNEKILIQTQRYPEYKYGDFLEIKGRLEIPENFSSDFDYRAYLKKDNISFVMNYPGIELISSCEDLGRIACVRVGIYKIIFGFKNLFESNINKFLPEPNASFVNGIILGSRGNIPQDLKDAFSKTGTSHILAISGWNISIIALYASSLFLLFMKRKNAFWLTSLAIVVFVIMTGASASVIRAAIMGILLLLGQRQARPYSVLNSIVFAGALMIWVNPRILRFDVGFQLSFLATLGLVYISPYLNKWLKGVSNVFKIRENLAMTISAQIAVLPILALNFNALSLAFIPTNILILPFVPLAMLFGFLSGISGMLVGFIGQVFSGLAWSITTYQIKIVELFAKIPLISLDIHIGWLFVSIYYFILGLVLYRMKKHEQ